MNFSRSSSKVKRISYKSSRSLSSNGSTDSRDSSLSGSRTSIQLSVYSNDTDANEAWRGILSAKLFVVPLEDRFVCVSCKKVLLYPVTLPICDHHVCSSCLADLCRVKQRCPVDGKKFNRDEAMVDEKLQHEIDDLKVVCPYKECGCVWTGKLEAFKGHYDLCEHTEQLCENGCNYRTSKRLMETHISVDCPMRLLACEFCKRHLKAEMEIEHLKTCPRFPVSCPKSCGRKDIVRENIPKHLNEECTLADFDCPYQPLGCTFKGSRIAIHEHVEECLKQHISLLCEGVLKHSQILSTQQVNLTECMQRLGEHEEKLSALWENMGAALLWKIDEWGSKMTQATSAKRTVLQSPPFYTARHQYKLSLSLLPNGDGKAKGGFSSLYVRICKGEYDSMLAWPFSHSMDLTLIDQSQDPRARQDFVYTLRTNPCKENFPFVGRPTAQANAGFGAQRFISHDILNSRDYVRDDVIFIRVNMRRD